MNLSQIKEVTAKELGMDVTKFITFETIIDNAIEDEYDALVTDGMTSEEAEFVADNLYGYYLEKMDFPEYFETFPADKPHFEAVKKHISEEYHKMK